MSGPEKDCDGRELIHLRIRYEGGGGYTTRIEDQHGRQLWGVTGIEWTLSGSNDPVCILRMCDVAVDLRCDNVRVERPPTFMEELEELTEREDTPDGRDKISLLPEGEHRPGS